MKTTPEVQGQPSLLSRGELWAAQIHHIRLHPTVEHGTLAKVPGGASWVASNRS